MVDTTVTTTIHPSLVHTIAMGPYGLNRIDYEKVKPTRWPVPPPPPPKPSQRKEYLASVLAFGFFASVIYIMFNREDEDMQEYWRLVDSGDVPIDDEYKQRFKNQQGPSVVASENQHNDEEEDDDDDNLEDFDEDQDEWED